MFPSGFAASSFKSSVDRSAFFQLLPARALGLVNTLLNRSDRQNNPDRKSESLSLLQAFAVQRVFMSDIKFGALKREFKTWSSAHA